MVGLSLRAACFPAIVLPFMEWSRMDHHHLLFNKSNMLEGHPDLVMIVTLGLSYTKIEYIQIIE
jgi:hypothetical protein